MNQQPKNLGGRPRGRLYTRQVTIMMTEEDYGAAKELARGKGSSLSEILRRLIREAAGMRGAE